MNSVSNSMFISIDAGVVTAAYVETAKGRRPLDHEIGTFKFYVTLVDPENGNAVLWSGPDYEYAMREAERCRIECDIDEPVHDNVAGAV